MAKNCIHVEPPFVEFKDVELGKLYKTVITATNVDRITREIFFENPKLKVFKFSAPRSAKNVAPGLSVSGLLEFIPEEEEAVTDYIYVHVDAAEAIEVPLQISPRGCSLSMDSELDFGFIPASSQIISRCIPITNHGSASGVFQVLHIGDSLVRLSPSSGVVAAGATRRLTVELHADKPRKVDEKAMVRLQNCSTVVLRIRAHVVEQHLEILDLQGAPVSRLCFGPVYFGTSRVEHVVLTNNGPQACDWVYLLEGSAAGTESGANLDNSTDVAVLAKMQRCSPAPRCPCPVVECIPNQGRLGPYKKTTVAVRFSPIFHRLQVKPRCQATRQDYCLFLHLDSVRSKHGFTHRNGTSTVELAVTGTGLPVALLPSPSNRFDFSTCDVGQRGEHLCVLQNLCPHLPIHFRFRKLAHFGAQPSSGTIAPGRCQDVVLYFNARQQGKFQMCQKLDVLGYVARHRANKTTEDDAELRLGSFYTISLHLSAICKIEMTPPSPKLNPGITPTVSNATGLRPHVASGQLACCYEMVRAAVVSARKTTFHMHDRKNAKSLAGEEFLALPNDRATSVRPASRHMQFRTIFTGVQRYTYVDPDYGFTRKEAELRRLHRQSYTDFIRQLRETRLEKIKTKLEAQGDNFGIIPAQGLEPPKLVLRDSKANQKSSSRLCYASCSPPKGKAPSARQGSVESHAVPTTHQEMADCDKTLTPKELYQVIIAPSFVDFGEVCFHSVCEQKVDLINPLPTFVRVQFEVDCFELQGSSPLSHVLPPVSHNSVNLTFQSNKLGQFYRPVSYTVNHQHPGQILVKAQVVRNYLELSTHLLILGPNANLLAASGYRNSVTLRNPRNQPAEFTWRPIVPESGILFSIRPATGTVEPDSELDCEVVWHASFSSPQEGDFDLYCFDGNIQRLHCIAKVGSTCIRLAENRLMFESVPLNMPSVRTIILHNNGQNHAYYRVLDVCPLPCMVVIPCEGVVPSRGKSVLKIHFNPDSVMKFDTRVAIALKNMKPIEVRVGGSVEPPNIDISVSHFHFCGVHIGSERLVPFAVINRSPAAARLTFNLSQYPNFSLQLPQPAAKDNSPVVRVVEVQGHQTVNCSLVFSPTESADYVFDLPLMVNGMRWPVASPPPSRSSSSPFFSSDSKCVIKMIPWSINMTMQQPHVQATVLCAPLKMSPLSLQFHVEAFAQPQSYTKTLELKAACEQSVCWHGIRGKSVRWRFKRNDTTAPEGRAGELHLSVSPSSGCLGPGQSIWLAISIVPEAFAILDTVTRLSLSLYLADKEGGKMGQPYKKLPITVIHQVPGISISPPHLILTPVPLESSITAKLTLRASGYASGTSLTAEVDEVELDDGTKVQPICITFPEGNTIPAQNQAAGVNSLICRVSFFSMVTLSIRTSITFTDHLNNRFKVRMCATSDNCLLTVWPQMALERSKQQIVLRAGATVIETITHHTPSLSSDQTSSPSLFEPISSTSKNSSSDSFAQSESGSQTSSQSFRTIDTPQTDIGVPLFPTATSVEGQYYQSVLLALERWFSFFGWLTGPHPITIPHTLRRIISEDAVNNPKGQAQGVSQKKDPRSAVEMIHHLAGRRIPNISHCQTFSTDVHQRTLQLLQQHEAIFAFLRVQGACLSHIRAEYLLDALEFNHWCTLQSEENDPEVDYNNVDYESLSKRCWTDFLLQIYKVLVLSRVKEYSPNITRDKCQEDEDGILNIHSLPSNLYSRHELQLLSWLNSHYHHMRETVWASGTVPPVRWIVNFDLDLIDGLVLAALLATYCPYLVSSHFQRMYTTTPSLEQILHNNIIIVQALTILSLNMDLQPTDLSDPNPVQMLMLCVHLYERLPQYQPINTITLSGSLHRTLSKQVHLKNPSTCLVKYRTVLLGRDATQFSLPDGSAVTIPPTASTDLTVQYCCSFLQPKEAILLLISTSASGLHGTTLTFKVDTCVSQITPTKSVKCKTPCYVLKVIKLPVTNTFNVESNFRVILVESTVNPLESEKETDSLIQQASFKIKNEKKTSDRSCHEAMAGKDLDRSLLSHKTEKRTNTRESLNVMHVCVSFADGDGSEFISTVSSVSLKPGQCDILNLQFLPFSPGAKYCAVLLICPQVGDMVYMVKAIADLPLPSPFRVRHSSNIFTIPRNTVGLGGCVSALRLRCNVGQICDELIRLPLINSSWESALAMWAQHRMTAIELQRRMLTYTLHSSSVRASMAACMLSKKQSQMRGVDYKNGVVYSVEVSLPRYFAVPSTVTMPLKKDTNIWKNPADHDCVEIPLRFAADSVGQFSCQIILRSCFDTRVYLMEALVTSLGGSVHLDFSSPAQQSVTQDIPLQNETHQDWTLKAELCGDGFYGPSVLNVPAGTRACYPLTFHPTSQCVVMGKLSLHNSYNGVEHVFTIRGVGERPLPVEHLVLRCPLGETTSRQLNVPNYTQKTLSLQVMTDLSIISGNSSLKVQPGQSALYTLAVLPRKRGELSGYLSFDETDQRDESCVDKGKIVGRYQVFYTLEIICEPGSPVNTLNVQCAVQSSVAIEIPVSNPGGELLLLNVDLEGDDLCGADWVLIPPQETLTYKVTFSPGKMGKSRGSVVFQSEPVGEFWYQLELYAIPSAVVTLPQACCPLGKWTRQSIPVVNPTADRVKVTVSNSNPRNYTLELASESTFTVEPRSATQLGVVFTPSSIGEYNHGAKITFTCPQLQQWCVLLFGRGLMPGREEPLSISCAVGASESFIIRFKNPTEHPATLGIALTDKDPSAGPNLVPVTPDKDVFSLSLSQSEGIQINEGGNLDVPVVFAPKSMDPQQAWLCISMKPLNTAMSGKRARKKLSTICWIYPLCGIPLRAPVDKSPLCLVQCEAGCQLEKRLDVLLTGFVPGAEIKHEVLHAFAEDFQCEVCFESETEDILTASIEAGRRDPETGVVTLTINLLFSPVKQCRCSAILVVQHASGQIWEFPLDVIATEAQVDDVIDTDVTEFGQTSAVGFCLTSTTRRPEPFTATFQPGSSNEFAVSPASGMLPPVDSSGALINVFFTPTAKNQRHNARLAIKASGMQWIYDVRGVTGPLSAPSPGHGAALLASGQQPNFVTRNRRIPALANSAPLKFCK
ncbi:cilia- and flagella-associated protein 47-like isoform X1 [Hippocampus zosterae]|uniref:cilia- and flagella-associated protein 47-like isoform X1 n=1 Tax=Hippocampus zosterae TaxID=109293 RepID=UPI00223CD859|nr:cilia- and flagella-associated protein 47-like isoform X1 [Hippocampus zosterae]